jgi:hypothetical protein
MRRELEEQLAEVDSELELELLEEREEHDLAKRIRRASATECVDCGGRLEYRVSRFAWVHVSKPRREHFPRPKPLGL